MPTEREKILQTAQKYVDRKRYDRAIAEYQRIVQQDPNDARTLLKIGDLQAKLEAYPEAIGTYDRVGQYYSAQGFALKAIAVYKQIRELIRKHAPALADRYGHILPRLAEIYTQLGLTTDALAAYDEVATRLQKTGRDRDAIEIFCKMVELDATNPLPHLRLAEARCRIQALDEAIESFWTAAELLLGMQRRDDALKVVERILHFRPDPRFARVAAELYLQKNDRENGLLALAKLQICFQHDPKDIDTLALLAQAFMIIGQENKSTEVYKEMARIAREQGRRDLFQQLLAHLHDVAPGDEQVRALQSLPPSKPPSSSHVPVSVGMPSSRVPDSTGGAHVVTLDDEIELLDDDLVISQPATATHARPIMTSAPDVVVVDEDLEAIEEIRDPSSFDAPGHARKSVVDAESFRKLRLYSKAIESLQIALEIDPQSLEIRHKLREVLVDAGRRDEAIAETLHLAVLHGERGETSRAEGLTYEILEIEPEHPGALQLLERLSPGTSFELEDSTRMRAPEEELLYDPSAPLPSYDLEGVSPERAMQTGAVPSREFEAIDDPFAGGAPKSTSLPQFPITQTPPSGNGQAAPTRSGDAIEGIEDALEEAEFFGSRGLYDDARTILVDALSRAPRHPLLRERLREIEEAIAASGESGTIERRMLGGRASDDRAFDIAASLEALDDIEVQPDASPSSFANMQGEIDVDLVFEKFKEGVRAQVADSDSSTHYDLGVAYKEMGLLADAINELSIAARDPQRECTCNAMIGMIELEQNNLIASAEAYVRALQSQVKTVEQEMSLYYDLGNVHELKQEVDEALYYFTRIARRDPGYRDVRDRIAVLRPPDQAPAASQPRAVNDDDEFDQVFNDLFEHR